jgi:benzoyl-CoA reductase/2-hydroxyglutaryl-CoA dehydratase subunit BcrC/BadD/HgdB
MNEQLHLPPWANEWIVDQAKRHHIDGALVLTPLGTKPSAMGNRFIERALERAGIPVLPVFTDMVDSRNWNAAEMIKRVGRFIEERL